MMKTMMVKAIALGLLSYAWVSGNSVEAGPACPVFTAAMVDATYMAINVSEDLPIGTEEGSSVVANDDPEIPDIRCEIIQNQGFRFRVRVFDDGRAGLRGDGSVDSLPRNADDFGTWLRTTGDNLTLAQQHACRAQVVQSFVWQQHCAPVVP